MFQKIHLMMMLVACCLMSKNLLKTFPMNTAEALLLTEYEALNSEGTSRETWYIDLWRQV